MDSYFRGRCDRLVLAAMKRDITITSDEAADMARHIRDNVSKWYQQGALTEFARGMYQGQLMIVQYTLRPEPWIVEGIENEIEFYCRRAQQAEARPR